MDSFFQHDHKVDQAKVISQLNSLKLEAASCFVYALYLH